MCTTFLSVGVPLLCSLLLLCAAPSSASAPSDALTAVEARLASSRGANRDHLLQFLRIASVSTDPGRRDQVREAGEWLGKRLEAAGLENVQLMSTNVDAVDEGGSDEFFPPVVYADWLHAADPAAPTLLIYGHYDVQPADPLDLWTSPPFEPRIQGDHIFARGASDDKGHMHVPIAAVEAWLNAVPSGLPVNVKFLFEGEEEVLSPHLLAFVKKHSAKFAADYAFSADGGQVAPEQPGLVMGLRGVAALQLDVYGASLDSHSGVYGGGIANPLQALTEILATIRDRESGHVLVPGFYKHVKPLDDEERSDFAKFEETMPVHDSLAMIGANVSTGEKGYSFYERTWARPSLEVVGMWGGFQGVGIKTVLPASAHAKISARLVYNQDPAEAIEAVAQHLKNVAADMPGIRAQISVMNVKAKAFLASKQGIAIRAATRVLTDVYNGTPPVYRRMGGSIPVTAILDDVLGLETVIFAFGHSDENIHAPDEFARLSSFDRGETAYARLFHVIAEEHRTGDQQTEGKCKDNTCNQVHTEL